MKVEKECRIVLTLEEANKIYNLIPKKRKEDGIGWDLGYYIRNYHLKYL